MKLVELDIKAFGPFAKQQTIDFTALGNNPLFLIDGPTGAGKSSILHAVCFALYGETTDADRKDVGVRSDHADLNDLTEVSLTFVTRGEKYRITRTPTQERPALRGGGVTKAQATANLVRIAADGTEESLVAKKRGEADKQIKEILGLTADQFRQVMVLPQGKFRELLISKSDDRQKILSTLFQTQIFQRIEELLKQQAKSIRRKSEQFNADKIAVYREHEVDSAEALRTRLASQKTEMDAAEEAGKVQGAKVQKLQEELAKAQSLDKLFADQVRVNSELAQHKAGEAQHLQNVQALDIANKAAAIAHTWRDFEQADKNLQLLVKELEQVQVDEVSVKSELEEKEKALHAAQEATAGNDSKRLELEKLKGYGEQLKELDAAQKQLKSSRDSFTKLGDQLKHSELEKSLTSKAIAEVEANSQANTERLKAKPNLMIQETENRQLLEKLKQRDALFNGIEVAGKNVLACEQKESDALNLTKTSEVKADRLELSWLNAQAAILAEKLQDGDACPVCGSESHPNLAQFGEDAKIDKAMVDGARSELADENRKLNQASSALKQARDTVVDLQKQKVDLEKSLGDNFSLSIESFTVTLQNLQKELADLEALEKLQAKAAEQLAALKSKLERDSAAFTELLQKRQTAEIQVTQAESDYQNLEKRIAEEYRDKEVLDKAIASLTNEIAITTKTLHAVQTAHKVANDRLVNLSGRQQTLAEQLGQAQNNRASCEQAWSEALASSQFSNQEEFDKARMTNEALEELRKTVQSYLDAITALDGNLALLKKQIGDQQRPEIPVLTETVNTENEALEAARKVFTDCRDIYRELDAGSKKMGQIEQQQKAIQDEYNVIGKLDEAASGMGKYKVTLERFVLASLLDEVLSQASSRLHLMSKGQYRLVRENEADSGKQKAAGLNLAVDDSHSGKTRPVSTLSGGESFMASLALALALSDVVQQRSGGIQMDTLFVDEGFGSLDQDSLQLAINTLVDIQASGRTIGIISHVSELKEQMAKRIDVLPGTNGSEIRMAAS